VPPGSFEHVFKLLEHGQCNFWDLFVNPPRRVLAEISLPGKLPAQAAVRVV